MDPTINEQQNKSPTEFSITQHQVRHANYTGLGKRLFVADLMLFLNAVVVYWRGSLDGPLGAPFWSGALAVLMVLVVVWYSIVLLIDRPHRPDARKGWACLVLSVPLVIGIAAYAIAPGHLRCYPLADAGFRILYAKPFQMWAQGILERPQGDLRHNGKDSPFLSDVEFPSWMENLQGSPRLWSRVVRSRWDKGMFPPGSHPYVVIGWDADFMGWGLLVGPPELRLPPGSSDRFRPIMPGIYRW